MSIVTLNPSASIYVQQGYPNQNRNSEDRLRFGTPSQLTWGLRTLMKFNFSSIPAGSIINSAKVSVYAYYDDSYYNEITYYIRRITSDWTPTTATWNNQPTYTATGQVSATHSGHNKWYESDITNLIKSLFDGTYTNYGIAFIQDPQVVETSKTVSRSGTYVPKLIIDYTPAGCKVKEGGLWKNGLVYVKNNGVWKQGLVYVKDSGLWKLGN